MSSSGAMYTSLRSSRSSAWTWRYWWSWGNRTPVHQAMSVRDTIAITQSVSDSDLTPKAEVSHYLSI